MVNNEKINYMHVGMGLYDIQKRGTDENIRKLTYMYYRQIAVKKDQKTTTLHLFPVYATVVE